MIIEIKLNITIVTKERNKPQETEVMPNTIAHHTLTSAQHVPDEQSTAPDQPPQFIH